MLRKIGFILAVCLAVGAGAAQAAAVNACSVLQPAAIRSALGVAPTAAGQARDIGVSHSCEWKLANGASLRLAVFDSPAANSLGAPAAKPIPAWQPLAGVGQKAGYRKYDFIPGVAVAEIEVVLPSSSFFVQVTGDPASMPKKLALLALARQVADKLP